VVGVVVTGKRVGDDVGEDIVVFVKRYGTNPDCDGDVEIFGVPWLMVVLLELSERNCVEIGVVWRED